MTRFAIVSLLWLTAMASAADRRIWEPAVMREDFQENTLGQWSGYPPVQDVGYDPSLSPTSEYGALGGRSLMRVESPPARGLWRFGFIKRLDMAASDRVRFSFHYRLLPAMPGTVIEIGLAGGDGHRYTSHVNGDAEGNWAEGTAQFADIPPGTEIQALYITASLQHADPSIKYRFLIDDVSLEATRAARFQVQVPREVTIPPWSSEVAARTYAPGETIAVEAAAPVPLVKAECILKDRDGRSVVRKALVSRNGVWSNESIHTVAASDAMGVWHIGLRGTTGDGRWIDTDVRILVRPERSDVHPKLYFGPGDRSALEARAHDPAFSRLEGMAANFRKAENISSREVFALLDPRDVLINLYGPYMSLMAQGGGRAALNALVTVVTGNAEARAAAKAALLDVAGWDTWIPPWFEAHGQHTYYPAGEMASNVAFAYDALYNDLSESERQQVGNALLRKGVIATYREYVLDNRIAANTSNWIGHTVAGAIVADIALTGKQDDPELVTYLGGLLMKMEDHCAASYLSDGSYGEGISYQEFDLQSTTLALSALDRVYGTDYWKCTFVKDSLAYPLYTLAQPTREGMDMGDSHPPAGGNIAAVVLHSQDPVMRWYYDRFDHRSFGDFLFPPASLRPEPPSQPVSRVFDQKGNVIFRTGWGPEDAILMFRAGPDYNHNHADQGGFLLRALGENLAVEGGYADYYADPYYRPYFTQASGHNTVLVDGDTASQEIADTRQFPALDSYPRITDAITSGLYDAVGSELSSVYKGRLKRFTRRIVFLKPNYVVIYDDLAANGSPVSFDWLLHVNERDGVRVDPGGALYQGEKASMGVRALEPEKPRIQVEEGHLAVTVNRSGRSGAPIPGVGKPPGIIDIASAAPSAAQQYLVVLTVAKTPEEANTMRSGARRIAGEACLGVQLGSQDVILFHAAGEGIARYGDWTTDARAWSSAGPVTAAELATLLTRGGKTLLRSDRPVSFAALYGDGSASLSIANREPATVRVFIGFRPRNLRGGEYSPADGTLRLRLEAGRRELAFQH